MESAYFLNCGRHDKIARLHEYVILHCQIIEHSYTVANTHSTQIHLQDRIWFQFEQLIIQEPKKPPKDDVIDAPQNLWMDTPECPPNVPITYELLTWLAKS